MAAGVFGLNITFRYTSCGEIWFMCTFIEVLLLSPVLPIKDPVCEPRKSTPCWKPWKDFHHTWMHLHIIATHKLGLPRLQLNRINVPVDFCRLCCISSIVLSTHCTVETMSNKGTTKREWRCVCMCAHMHVWKNTLGSIFYQLVCCHEEQNHCVSKSCWLWEQCRRPAASSCTEGRAQLRSFSLVSSEHSNVMWAKTHNVISGFHFMRKSDLGRLDMFNLTALILYLNIDMSSALMTCNILVAQQFQQKSF